MPNELVEIHITPTTAIGPTIAAFEMYLSDQGRSSHTIKAFISDLQLMQSYFSPDKTISSVTTIDLNNFLRWMEHDRGVPCSPKTLSRRITSIKSYFKWLNKSGATALNPAEKVVQRTVRSPLPSILDDVEKQSALITAEALRHKTKPDTRPYTLLYLLLNTGIKKSECLSIHINHFDFSEPRTPILHIRYSGRTNEYKERKLIMDEEWTDIFQSYCAQYKPNDTLFPWSPRRLEYVLEDIAKDANIEKHISFDMCRWTYAVNQYLNGVGMDEIRMNLGVSKIQFRELGQKIMNLAALINESSG